MTELKWLINHYHLLTSPSSAKCDATIDNALKATRLQRAVAFLVVILVQLVIGYFSAPLLQHGSSFQISLVALFLFFLCIMNYWLLIKIECCMIQNGLNNSSSSSDINDQS